MWVRLLGSVEAEADGTAVAVPGLRPKAVLAALALRSGTAMSVDELVTAVWGDTAPATATTTLQSHISRLRRILGTRDAIIARQPGYQLNLGPEPSDAHVAERLVGEAAEAGDPEGLRRAVALWRGRPLADLTHLTWFAGHARRFEDLLLRARNALVDARLARGEHAALLPELEEMSRRHPFHEQTHAQLILALYRAGRQGDALAAYRRLRDTLGDELGVDPSPPLRDLEAAILRHDETLDNAPPPPRPTIAMVPPAPAGFSGRTAGMSLMDTARQLAVVWGPAGVGKTSLALHWAHRAASRFPDGQLYVDLRGFDPALPPLRPAEVIRGFLDALGVPPQRIPGTTEVQIGLYRGLLAGRRMLVVLDNAADSAQIRPLLPAAPGCLTVVTSRRPLTPLVAAQGGDAIALDLFTTDEAREMLTARLGAAQVAADPAATEAVIARCARLPLALAVVAARAAARPSFPLATFAAELSTPDVLDALDGGDPAVDARAAFSWSYRELNADTARLFRLLSAHPGPDVTVPAAASLVALTAARTGQLLAELVDAQLLTERAPGRYSCHDLLRAYAKERAEPQEWRAALRRVLDHYLHSAHGAAARLPSMVRVPVVLEPPADGVQAEDHLGTEWFAAEHVVLVAAIEHAVSTGFPTAAWQLAHALGTYQNLVGDWAGSSATHQRVLDVVTDPLGRGLAEDGVAFGHFRCDRFDEADKHFRRALDHFTAAGSAEGQIVVHRRLTNLWLERNDPDRALDHAWRAHALVADSDDPVGVARALNHVGWCLTLRGDHAGALDRCLDALAVMRRAGDHFGMANTLDTIGHARLRLGQAREAITCYRRAYVLLRKLGDRFPQADVLLHLGDAYETTGEADKAREAWQEALDILTELDHSLADRVRDKLRVHAG